MRIFLDANVLVSVLNKEYPLFSYSSRIVSLADDARFQVYTSPICLAIAFYFAEKKSGSMLAKKKITVLVEKLKIAQVDEQSVQKTIANRRINDFEDGLEYYAASKAACKCIITEDISDFHFSDIEVINSQKFFEKYLIRR